MSLVLELDSGEEICLVQGIKNLIYCHFFSFTKSAFVLHGRRRKRNGVMAEIQSTFVIFMLCSTGLAQTQKTATHKDILTKIVVVNISNYDTNVNTWKMVVPPREMQKMPKRKVLFWDSFPLSDIHSVRHPLAEKPLKLTISNV